MTRVNDRPLVDKAFEAKKLRILPHLRNSLNLKKAKYGGQSKLMNHSNVYERDQLHQSFVSGAGKEHGGMSDGMQIKKWKKQQ
jgi:hypothetical protein